MNKKNILLVCLVLMCLAFIFAACTKFERNNALDPGAINYISYKTNKIVICHVEFDRAPPIGWTEERSTNTLYQSPQAFSGYDGNTSLATYSFTTNRVGDYIRIFTNHMNLTGHFFVEFYLKDMSNLDWDMTFRFFNTVNVAYLAVGLQQDKFYYYNESFKWGDVFTASVWYLIKLEVNLDTMKFSAWYKIYNEAGFHPIGINQDLPADIPNPITKIDIKSRCLMNDIPKNIFCDDLSIYKLEVVEIK